MTEEELKQIDEDCAWWQAAGAKLNLRLTGWTFRNSANFIDIETGHSLHLPGRVAARLHQLERVEK